MAKNKSNDRKFLGRNKPEVGFPVASSLTEIPSGYSDFLKELKTRIGQERLRVVIASNAALINMYWDIGNAIIEKQAKEGWGAKVIDRLSADLKKEFPDMKGFSPRNLKYMRAFASAWIDKSIVQGVLAQITWYHNILRHPDDKLSIGLLLVKQKNKLVAEYALRGYTKPIGISEWETQITRKLPASLKSSLPSIEEIEAELGGNDG